jgi:hypothetical protein
MGLLDMLFGGDGQPQQNSLPMDELRQLGLSDGLINYYQQEQAKAQKAQMWNNAINGVANIASGAQGMGPRFGGGGDGGGGSSGPGANTPLGLDGLVDRALKFSQIREGIAKQRQSAEARAAIPELAKALGIDVKTAAALIDQLPSMYKENWQAGLEAKAPIRKGDALLDASGVTDPADRQNFYRRQTMPAPEIKEITLPGGEKVSLRINPTTGAVTDLNNNPMPADALSGSNITQKMGPVIGDGNTGYYVIDPKTKQPISVLPGKQSLGVSEDVYKAETGLRGEYTQQAKEFGGRQTAFMTMEDLAKQGEGASDIALVLSLMKVYDPTSTVTGSEAANAQNAAGVPAAIRSKYNQLIGGGKLDQQSRDELVTAARIRFDQELDNQGKIVDYYTDLSKKYRVDPTRVVNDVRDPRLLDERFGRQVPSFAPDAIMGMSGKQLSTLEKFKDRMSIQQLQAAAQRKRMLEGSL